MSRLIPTPSEPAVKRSERQAYLTYLSQTHWSDWRGPGERPWWADYLAEFLELHYLVYRGLLQKAMPKPWPRIFAQLRRAPYTLPMLLVLPLFRLGQRCLALIPEQAQSARKNS